jgi:hypothetical protein
MNRGSPSANDATASGLSKAPEIWTFEPITPRKSACDSSTPELRVTQESGPIF